MKRLYLLTGACGAIGFVAYLAMRGFRPAAAFALGTAGSFGNLWLWNWLTRFIEPQEPGKKPWGAGLFIGRYLVLWAFGYAIVKALNVNVLAVVLGLLVSSAAVLISLTIEIMQGFLRNEPNR